MYYPVIEHMFFFVGKSENKLCCDLICVKFINFIIERRGMRKRTVLRD